MPKRGRVRRTGVDVTGVGVHEQGNAPDGLLDELAGLAHNVARDCVS